MQCIAVELKDGDSIDSLPFINLIDVTLACEDAYSKLVEVVTVADVSDEILLATVCSRFGS